MKKFKLIALTLLASTFGLTSCDAPAFLNKVPGINKLIPQKEQKEEVQDGVVSVKINSNVSVVTDETEPFKLVAKVEVNGNVSKNVTWSSSDESVATVDENGLVTPLSQGTVVITATSSADSSKSDSLTIEVTTVPGVASVTIEGGQEEVVLHTQSMQLSAVVATKGAAAKGVTWSSSDESIATVNASGLVYFVGPGSVTITATSVADSSKSDSVTVRVINHGLHPELVEEGWTFVEEWPYAEAKVFTGKYVDGFESKEGFYFVDSPASGYNAAYFAILAEETSANIVAALSMLEESDLFYFYNSSEDLDCFLDVTQSYELDVFEYEIDNYSDALAFVYYHADDMFDGSTVNTTDTNWDDDTLEALATLGVELPFARLGEDYYPYIYSSGMVEISDECKDFRKLMNYDLLLEAAGFELEEREDEDVFVKSVDEYTNQVVSYLFNQYGNTIRTWLELKELDAFPQEGVDEFVESIPSKYEVSPFESETNELTYTFELSKFQVDAAGKDIRDCAVVGVYGLDYDDFEDYALELYINEDFDLIEFEEEEGYDYCSLQKGKLCIYLELNYLLVQSTPEETQAVLDAYEPYSEMSDEELAALSAQEYAYYEYLYDLYIEILINYIFGGGAYFTYYDYDTVDNMYLVVYGDERGMEEPGLYIYESAVEAPVEAPYEVEVIFFELDEAEVTFTSSDETIATVDENGVVTPLDVGKVTITATTTVDEVEYSDSIEITFAVTIKWSDMLTAWNKIFASHEVTDTLALPEPADFAYTKDAKDYWSYDQSIRAYFSTTDTRASYGEKLEAAGYRVDSANGYAYKGEFKIDYWYIAYGYIDIYWVEPLPTEWPAEEVAALLETVSFGDTLQDSIPAYQAENTSYEVYTSYGMGVTCYVGEENQDSAITAYGALLLENKYTYDEQTKLYTSEHNEIAIELWKGTDGAINIEISRVLAEGFIARHLTNFMTARGVTGVTLPDFSSLEQYALSENGNFDFDGYYYPMYQVVFSGDITEQVFAAMTTAGWDVPTTAGDYGYECFDATGALEIDVKVNSSGNTTITAYSYADF